MRRLISYLSWCALLLSLSGCVLSKSTIAERTPELKYTTSDTVSLTVVDNRPYVLNGDKDETFEGFQRAAYGIPLSITKLRDDNKVLYAARFADIISHALSKSGSKVTIIATNKSASVQDAIARLRTVPFTTGLVVNVLDSKIDAGGFRWSYYYDYEVLIVDAKGAIVSTKKYNGEDIDFQREIYQAGRAKGKSYEWPAILDIEYANRITAFLSDNDTAKALGGIGPSIATSTTKSTSNDGAERLIALKALLDKGVITPDDYEKKKAEILKSL